MQIGVTGDEEVVFVCVTSVKVRRRVTSRTVTLIFLATPRRWNLGNEIFRCTYSTYSPIDSFIHFSATLSSMFTFSLGLYLRPNWSGGKKKKKKSWCHLNLNDFQLWKLCCWILNSDCCWFPQWSLYHNAGEFSNPIGQKLYIREREIERDREGDRKTEWERQVILM